MADNRCSNHFGIVGLPGAQTATIGADAQIGKPPSDFPPSMNRHCPVTCGAAAALNAAAMSDFQGRAFDVVFDETVNRPGEGPDGP